MTWYCVVGHAVPNAWKDHSTFKMSETHPTTQFYHHPVLFMFMYLVLYVFYTNFIIHHDFRLLLWSRWELQSSGFYATRSGKYLMTFQDNISVLSSRVKNPKDSWPLKMGPIGSLETQVRGYYYLWCKNPEECSSLLTICHCAVNPLNMKRRLLYLKTQFIPRSKHFSSQL